MNIKAIDVKNKILIISAETEVEYGEAERVARESLPELFDSGCKLVITLSPGQKIEDIDEREMNTYGWYRK